MENILFVDDDRNILDSFERSFKKEGFQIFTALSGEEGLKVVHENEIALVVSDYSMPKMNGIEFLNRVKELSPSTIRIILTGCTDLKAAIEAINQGEVYRFINKPINKDELKLTINQSLAYRELCLKNKQLSTIVKQQSSVLSELEKKHPGITDIKETADGAIIIDEESIQDLSMDDFV